MDKPLFAAYTILVAEDNNDNFEYIWHTLDKTGIKIVRARDGAEAVALCHEHPEFSLILMDGMMPRMTGYQAATEIKKFRMGLTIVILTGYVDQSSIEQAVLSGCNDYLAKPIGIEELFATLKKWLVK